MTASTPRLPAFAGSLREGSYHRLPVPVPAEGVRAAGAGVSLIELRDVPPPLLDGDTVAPAMPGNVWVAAQALARAAVAAGVAA